VKFRKKLKKIFYIFIKKRKSIFLHFKSLHSKRFDEILKFTKKNENMTGKKSYWNEKKGYFWQNITRKKV